MQIFSVVVMAFWRLCARLAALMVMVFMVDVVAMAARAW